MNSSRLPLSLVVLLATTTTSVCAQSALDPYEHIKAPASKKAPAPAADDPVSDKIYVTMPMGESAEAGDGKKSKFGFMPKVKMPNMGGIGDKFKSAGSAVASKTKDMGSGIANGAKASGGFMKKPFNKGGNTKVASKQEDWSKGSRSAGRSASVEDLYVRDTKKQIERSDPGKAKQVLAKTQNPAKDKSFTETALLPMKGAGSATKKLFSPLGKLKPKPKDEERPASGFYEGALAKHDQDIADKQKAAAEKAAAEAKAAAPTGTPEALAATPATKKSKYGMGMLTKLKSPSIPFMGKKDGTAKVAKRAQVLDPGAEAASAPTGSALDPTVAAAKPAAPAAAPVAAAAPATIPVTTPIDPAVVNGKPAGPGKMANMKAKMNGSFAAMGGGLSKMNPFKKKGIAAPPKATPVADANKPAL